MRVSKEGVMGMMATTTSWATGAPWAVAVGGGGGQVAHGKKELLARRGSATTRLTSGWGHPRRAKQEQAPGARGPNATARALPYGGVL